MIVKRLSIRLILMDHINSTWKRYIRLRNNLIESSALVPETMSGQKMLIRKVAVLLSLRSQLPFDIFNHYQYRKQNRLHSDTFSWAINMQFASIFTATALLIASKFMVICHSMTTSNQNYLQVLRRVSSQFIRLLWVTSKSNTLSQKVYDFPADIRLSFIAMNLANTL